MGEDRHGADPFARAGEYRFAMVLGARARQGARARTAAEAHVRGRDGAISEGLHAVRIRRKARLRDLAMAMMFSATQVESFLLCPRKWAWSKLDGISSPPTPAAELGTIVHAQLENWLGYGIPFDCSHKSGDIAYAGLEHLPRPNTPGMTVEEAFVLELGGHTWRGLKDVQILDRQPPLVLDHETTRDIDLFARSPEELRTNVQACLYAADAMVRTDSDTCELYW